LDRIEKIEFMDMHKQVPLTQAPSSQISDCPKVSSLLTYYPTMILILHSLARLVWGVALAHAGPPEERQVGRLYHDASLAINPGVVNQKRPAGNQVDIHDSEDYLDPEAHVTPFHWRTFGPARFCWSQLIFLFCFEALTFDRTISKDPESLSDSKRHKRGQFEAASGRCSKSHLRHDFLSLGIAPSTSSLRMPPGTSQGKKNIDPAREKKTIVSFGCGKLLICCIY
jgi:hypothetical protein